MLFTQHNGLAQAIGGEAEADVVQEMACTIGPRVDGLAVGRITPQAMGAFSTYGAQAACAGYGQQKEQHTPTTMAHRELGDSMGASLFPTTSTSTQILQRAIALKQEALAPTIKTVATDTSSTPVAPSAPAAPAATPAAAAAPGTYPPGTITAFNPSTNMWRVAVPVALGLGIFGAPAAFTEVAPAQSPPNGATQVSQTQFEKQTGTLPIYKRPLFWVAVVGGVAVLGGGGYLLFRRKRV